MADQLKTDLTTLVKNLLTENDTKKGKEICQSIYELLMTEFEFDLNQSKSVKTHFGQALDPRSTARTLLLPTRNKRYLQATLKALSGNKKKVLYLGCGSFAPFFLFPLLLGHRAEFTLLEISDYSISILEKVIQRFQLEKFVHRVEKADAAIWKADRPYDLVIGGVNDYGMRYEDSFEIHKNIYRQLPNAQHIPQNILLYLKQDEKVDYFDSLLAGIERGQLRQDCPYPKEMKPILQTKVQVDKDLSIEPEESVITGSAYFYAG